MDSLLLKITTYLKKMKESKIRSLVKGISWRVVGTIDTIFISFLLTGKLKTAFSIGGIELFSKVVLYYFHERVWIKIKFGKKNNDGN